MDYESDRSRRLGCWDAINELTAVIDLLTSLKMVSSWEIPQPLCDNVVDSGFGENSSTETRQFWTKHLRDTYSSNEGILKLRQSAINLRDRDGLHGRLGDITCPVLRMQGDKDVVYTVANAVDETKLFTSATVKFVEVKGGSHYLSWSNPSEVEQQILKFIASTQEKKASL
jgi:pimeloyl-ACP methyl ester carboxylesterase